MADSYFFTPAILGSGQAISTSLANIAGFSFNVAAGGIYRYSAFLNVTIVGSSIQIGFTMGGTLSEGVSAYDINIGSTTTGTRTNQIYVAIPGAATQTGVIAAGTWPVTIRGLVQVTGSGTLTVQGIRTGLTSATVLAGSTFTLEQIA